MVELPVSWILRFVIVDLIIFFFICTFSLQKKTFGFYIIFFFLYKLTIQSKKIMDFSLSLNCKYCREATFIILFTLVSQYIFLKKNTKILKKCISYVIYYFIILNPFYYRFHIDEFFLY
jgi:hypothetical protein